VANNRSIGLYLVKNGDEVKFKARSPIIDFDTADSSPPLLLRFEKVITASPGEKLINLNTDMYEKLINLNTDMYIRR